MKPSTDAITVILTKFPLPLDKGNDEIWEWFNKLTEAVDALGSQLKSKRSSKVKLDDDEWFESLRHDVAYRNLNLDQQFAMAQRWCDVNNRQCTRRFFTNWLIRAATASTSINVSAGLNPKNIPQPSQHTMQEALKLLEAEIKLVNGRGWEDAFGVNLSPKDAEKMKELKAKRKELKAKLGL